MFCRNPSARQDTAVVGGTFPGVHDMPVAEEKTTRSIASRPPRQVGQKSFFTLHLQYNILYNINKSLAIERADPVKAQFNSGSSASCMKNQPIFGPRRRLRASSYFFLPTMKPFRTSKPK
jgi:hypothetical protein